MNTETIVTITIFLVALVLLIVLEVKKMRFLWRFILLYIVSFSSIAMVGTYIGIELKLSVFNSALVVIREQISKNDIQSIYDAFRNFDPSSKLLFKEVCALQRNLMCSTNTTLEKLDSFLKESRSFDNPVMFESSEEESP